VKITIEKLMEFKAPTSLLNIFFDNYKEGVDLLELVNKLYAMENQALVNWLFTKYPCTLREWRKSIKILEGWARVKKGFSKSTDEYYLPSAKKFVKVGTYEGHKVNFFYILIRRLPV